jgi:hypothetical protein
LPIRSSKQAIRKELAAEKLGSHCLYQSKSERMFCDGAGRQFGSWYAGGTCDYLKFTNLHFDAVREQCLPVGDMVDVLNGRTLRNPARDKVLVLVGGLLVLDILVLVTLVVVGGTGTVGLLRSRCRRLWVAPQMYFLEKSLDGSKLGHVFIPATEGVPRTAIPLITSCPRVGDPTIPLGRRLQKSRQQRVPLGQEVGYRPFESRRDKEKRH